MILSLRGTHGSGKSTVLRALLNKTVWRPMYGVLGPRLPEAYELQIKGGQAPLHVIGPYNVQCGGCDRIQPFDLILELLEKYAAKGHVLFEGALIGCSYGRAGRFMEHFGKDGVFLVLDTSRDECVRRVKGRRDERYDDREFTTKNLDLKYKQLVSLVKRVEGEGILRVVRVSDKDAVGTILKLAKEAPRHDPPKQADKSTDILGTGKGEHPPEKGLW